MGKAASSNSPATTVGENAIRYAIRATMKPKPEHKPDDPAQYERFLEAARKAEADETEEGADRAFKKVSLSKVKAKAKPSL